MKYSKEVVMELLLKMQAIKARYKELEIVRDDLYRKLRAERNRLLLQIEKEKKQHIP